MRFLAANPSIEYIRYQWLDYSGILRVRNVTKSHCLSLATSNKPIMIARCAHITLVNNTMFNGLPIGSNTLWPDWQSLRRTNAGGDGGVCASVMCRTREPDTNDLDTDYRHCPRATLQRVLKQAEDSYGLDFLVGFEVEFMLMGNSEDGRRYPLLQNGGHWTASACRTQVFVHVQECVDTLRVLDVAVQQFHSEGKSGQFEISLAPLPPMEAVDTLILTQEVIKTLLSSTAMRQPCTLSHSLITPLMARTHTSRYIHRTRKTAFWPAYSRGCLRSVLSQCPPR